MSEQPRTQNESDARALTICVVICTRDRAHDVLECMESIAMQTVRPDRVVIVSGSDESVPPDIDARYPDSDLRVVECYEHNISRSRNVGLDHSNQDLVVFIDDDAIACEDWLFELRLMMERSSCCVIGGGAVYDVRESPKMYEFYQGLISPLGTQRPVCEDLLDRKQDRFVLGVKGCNFVVRRQWLVDHEIRFDEFFRFAYDETDLVMSVRSAGGAVDFNERAWVDHNHTPGHYRQSGVLDHDWRVQYASHMMFVLKHA